MAAPDLTLDEHLCFALYAASRAMTGFYRPLLDELGLTYPQYLVLLAVGEAGDAAVKDVADAVRLDYGTLSPLLQRMESAGLLTRERDAVDERRVLLALTDEGKDRRRRAGCLPEAATQALGLDAGDIRALRDQLHALAEHLSARG